MRGRKRGIRGKRKIKRKKVKREMKSTCDEGRRKKVEK